MTRMSPLCLFALIFAARLTTGQSRCNPNVCKPPECLCPSTTPPGNLNKENTPQLVLVSFDDAVTKRNIDFYRKLFSKDRKNPNGCGITATFFVTDNGGTDYSLVKELYKRGHGIGSHTVSHRLPQNWWLTASKNQLTQEFAGQKTKLQSLAGIPERDIKGARVPFLAIGGDTMYDVLKESGFQYDSSFSMGPFTARTKNTVKPYFPFTLNTPANGITCTLPGCPTKPHPGTWEIPLIRMYGNRNDVCSMTDGCTTVNAEDTYNYLMDNFNRYYNSNKAPFGLHMHATWFRKPYNLVGLDKFLIKMVSMPNVWIVSMDQAIDWLRHPTPSDQLPYFKPWLDNTGCQRTGPKSWIWAWERLAAAIKETLDLVRQ